MHRLGAGGEAGGDDLVGNEVAFARRWRPDVDRLIGLGDVQRRGIGVRIDGNGLDAHGPRRADDAAGDFAAIGDQDLLEHARFPFPRIAPPLTANPPYARPAGGGPVMNVRSGENRSPWGNTMSKTRLGLTVIAAVAALLPAAATGQRRNSALYPGAGAGHADTVRTAEFRRPGHHLPPGRRLGARAASRSGRSLPRAAGASVRIPMAAAVASGPISGTRRRIASPASTSPCVR